MSPFILERENIDIYLIKLNKAAEISFPSWTFFFFLAKKSNLKAFSQTESEPLLRKK